MAHPSQSVEMPSQKGADFPLPNFFIVGAAKAGTSSLWGYLNEHPEIFMSAKKEPGYFCDEWPGPKRADRYFKLFESAQAQHKWVGEASTMYLSCPGTAKNIYDYTQAYGVPQVKLMMVLRNPADRAYSLYNWQVQEGYEYASTFEKAIDLEESRMHMRFPNSKLTGGYRYNYMYYHSGLYADQVAEYFQIFGRENVKVLIFEEFVRDVSSHLHDVYDFLELDLKDFEPEIKVYNPSYDVHAPWLQFGLRKINRTFIERKPMNKILKTKEQRDALLSLGLKKGKPPKLSPERRNALLETYRPDVERLSHILQKDLSIWY